MASDTAGSTAESTGAEWASFEALQRVRGEVPSETPPTRNTRKKKKEILVTRSMCEAWTRDGTVLEKYASRRGSIYAGTY